MSLFPIKYPIKFAILCLLSFTIFTAETFAASLDTDFGDNGKVAVDLGSYGDQGNAVFVQPDGKILVGGSTSSTADLDFMLFRLLADGSLDSEFNFDGTVSTAIGSDDDEVFALALQEDGKILAAGYSSNNGSRDFAVARYNSNGSLDREFGLEGMMVTAVSDSDDEITGVAVQSDGKILLTGTALGDEGRVVVLARYQSNGTPDYTFADEGFALSAVGTDVRAESLLLTEEGRILIAGTYSEEENTALMVLGYDDNGDVDTSFGYEGVTVPLDGTVSSSGYGMAVRDDGSILVAGSVGEDGTRDGALFLFGEDGLPDRTFGDQGVLVTDDEDDTIFYDVLITEEMIAATGVTVAEGGMREALLITYTREDGANSEQLFQQQVADASTDAVDEDSEEAEIVAQVVTTEVDNEEDYAFSLAAADAGSVIVVGASGSEEVASAAVSKYTVFQSSVSGSSWSTATGNAYVLTGEAQDVTRTTALIPGEILSGLGTVTERGVVFSTDPLPVLEDSDDSSTDDDTDEDDEDSDDSSSETDETAPYITTSTSEEFLTTESVVLSVSTDEAAYCKYDTVDQDYSEMGDNFSSTADTSHSVDFGTFSEGTYYYYVRCMDEEGNTNTTSTQISFTVTEDDITAPIITSDDNNGQTYKTGEDVTLGVTTNETATCKYNENEDMNYADMPSANEFSLTDGTDHTKWFGDDTAFSTDEHIFFVRCEDLSQNESNPRQISFIVTPVIVSNRDFSSGILSVTTDVSANCGYNDGSDVAYDSMTKFTTTGATEHEVDLSALPIGSYTYYVRCQDALADETPVGTAIPFTVASTIQPDDQTTRLFASSFSFKAGLTTALENVGDLFVSTAIAQDDEDITDEDTDTSDVDTEDSNFLEEGSVDEGSDTGKFTAKLEDLKPGTFFYARAYAVVDDTVYYGNQISFQTADSCFVATAAYGSLFHPAVQLLRDFRDRFMLDNPVSRSLVRMYYHYSPPIADVISSNTILRSVTRTLLMPIIGSAWLTMRFGWLWLILPAAALVMLSWFGMQTMQVVRKEEL
ncbi:hypothetical protein KKHLCK_00320 [Candidatus Electrothrix laxa]